MDSIGLDSNQQDQAKAHEHDAKSTTSKDDQHTITTHMAMAGRECFDWETGQYTDDRRYLHSLDRLFVYIFACLLAVASVLSAVMIIKRTPDGYDLMAPTFPEQTHWWREVARWLLFGGGVLLAWSSVLMLIEILPMAIWWWHKQVGKKEVPGMVIATYVHIFDATWALGAAVLAISAANLASMLFPEPAVHAAIAAPAQIPMSELEALLKTAESHTDAVEKDRHTLEALRHWLRLKAAKTSAPEEKTATIDASKHLFAIVKNLNAMSWQMRLVRVSYLLAVYFGLKLGIKLIMSYTAVTFHQRTLQQRLSDNKQAIATTKKLRNRLLPNHAKHATKHAELGAALFDRVCPTGMEYVTLSELREFLPADQATAYMELIDLDGNGDVSRDEFVIAVQSFYQERDNLYCSLSINSKIIDQLSGFLSVLVWFVSFLTALVLLDETVTSTLKAVGGTVLSLTFIFGGTAADAFQSILFILLSHPFDVGDSILIDGKYYRVKELGLWTCTFVDGTSATVYITNQSIRKARISNTRRSGRQAENLSIKLASTVSDRQLEQMETELCKWVNENDRDYEPNSFRFTKVTVMDRDRIAVEMELTHKSNFQDGGIKRKRSRAFFFVLRDTLRKMNITIAPPVE